MYLTGHMCIRKYYGWIFEIRTYYISKRRTVLKTVLFFFFLNTQLYVSKHLDEDKPLSPCAGQCKNKLTSNLMEVLYLVPAS